MAEETADFTKNQILLNAGTSVLTQANVSQKTAEKLLEQTEA